MCGCADGSDSSGLYFPHSGVQVLHGGQLTVNHVSGRSSEEAQDNSNVTDDVERRDVEPIWGYREKCSVKAC